MDTASPSKRVQTGVEEGWNETGKMAQRLGRTGENI